jgi:REP element-mobilizing transposase RayT
MHKGQGRALSVQSNCPHKWAGASPAPTGEYFMKYDPTKHHRRSIRLKGFDYHNAGAYFVTICTKNRECVLEDPIVNGIIHDVWYALPSWFPTIELDEFMVMPNHAHFVVWNNVGTPLAGVLDTDVLDTGVLDTGVLDTDVLDTDVLVDGNADGAGRTDGGKPRPYQIPKPQKINLAPTLGDIVGAFKSLVFKVYLDWIEINDPSRRAKFWQHNYYEHIVRNDRELNAIRQYIIDNPIHWKMDRDNLENLRKLPPPKKVEEYLEDIEELPTNFEGKLSS